MIAMSEHQKSRANWIIDKILLVVCGWLIVHTYGRVTEDISKVSSKIEAISSHMSALESRTSLLEYRADEQRETKRK